MDNSNQELDRLNQLLKRPFLLRFPRALEKKFRYKLYKHRLNTFKVAYPTAIVQLFIIGLLITDWSNASLTSVSFHMWAGITLTYLIGYIIVLRQQTYKDFFFSINIISIPIIGLVLLRGLSADTFDEQIKAFFLIGYYYIFSYTSMSLKYVAGRCFITAVLALSLAYFLKVNVNWLQFHLYFSFSNFVGIMISTSSQALFRYTFLQGELKAASHTLSRTDSLTNLANRRHFDEFYGSTWSSCIDYQRPLSILLIDIDHYKQYNDSYGHIAGDLCLAEVAKLLKVQASNDKEIVARYGGEEFIIALPNKDKDGAIQIAKQIQEQLIEKNIEHKSSPIDKYLTVSIGIATCQPTTLVSPKKLIKEADEALYQAKDSGRNRWCYKTIDSD